MSFLSRHRIATVVLVLALAALAVAASVWHIQRPDVVEFPSGIEKRSNRIVFDDRVPVVALYGGGSITKTAVVDALTSACKPGSLRSITLYRSVPRHLGADSRQTEVFAFQADGKTVLNLTPRPLVVYLINPSGAPPSGGEVGPAALILASSRSASDPAWRDWAVRNGVPVTEVPDTSSSVIANGIATVRQAVTLKYFGVRPSRTTSG